MAEAQNNESRRFNWGHSCYRAICTLIEEKVKGKQIGVTGDYPITITSIGYLFLFRVVGPVIAQFVDTRKAKE
jgi:hypothetical protein